MRCRCPVFQMAENGVSDALFKNIGYLAQKHPMFCSKVPNVLGQSSKCFRVKHPMFCPKVPNVFKGMDKCLCFRGLCFSYFVGRL